MSLKTASRRHHCPRLCTSGRWPYCRHPLPPLQQALLHRRKVRSRVPAVGVQLQRMTEIIGSSRQQTAIGLGCTPGNKCVGIGCMELNGTVVVPHRVIIIACQRHVEK